MKISRDIHSGSKLARPHGVSLVECLLYIAVFFVIGTLAFASYYRVDFETRALDRNTDDIVRAMKAGERWRSDVRLSTTAPRMENGALRLTTKDGEVIYSVRENVLWRHSGTKSLSVLERVKASTMEPDSRQHVAAWRWELEMQTKRAQASVRPLFTFISVPGSEVKR
jgi:hypothetical protein